ncbi:unnamed protein product, partial [Discosporangium mesarthrocarpum]
GNPQGVPGGGGSLGPSGAGAGESVVGRVRGSTGRMFVAGTAAELRGLLLSDHAPVRQLSMRLAGLLVALRRPAMEELFGEELLSAGFSLLEPTKSAMGAWKSLPGHFRAEVGAGATAMAGAGAGAALSQSEVEDDGASAADEETRFQGFAFWFAGSGEQEAALREGFDRATTRAYSLVPHVPNVDGVAAAVISRRGSMSGGMMGSAG